MLLVFFAFSFAQAAAAQSDPAKQIIRAEKRFDAALSKREVAYDDLLVEYEACESWIADENSGSPPFPIQKYLKDSAIPEADWERRRPHLLGELSFAEFWNKSLFKLSRKATAFAVASRTLERNFHALEKLRHPERYQHGANKTPTGMALIPGGKYDYPASEGYLLGHDKITEPRQVSVRAFYLDRREVSNAEYARFLLVQPAALREEHLPAGWSWSAEGAPLFPDGQAANPVTGVSWSSANNYAEWNGKRLATEDEWQAAAMGFSMRRYPMGDRFDASKTNTHLLGAGFTRSVDSFPEDSTPQGIMCLTGNVREWTSDLYGEPKAGKVKKHKDLLPDSLAVVKGGSFQDKPDKCQSAYRWLYPAWGTRLNFVGFRCAMDVR